MNHAMTPKEVSEAVAGQLSAQFLMFLLDDHVFSIDISTVREIIQFGNMTPVPLMPDFVRGVINLRGAVVPVIDLKARFGWPCTDVGKKTCIIIFDVVRENERTELGLMVDAVTEVVDIQTSHIEPAPQFGTAVSRDFIHGIGKVDGKFIIILDPVRTLDIDEMAQAAEQAHEFVRTVQSGVHQ